MFDSPSWKGSVQFELAINIGPSNEMGLFDTLKSHGLLDVHILMLDGPCTATQWKQGPVNNTDSFRSARFLLDPMPTIAVTTRCTSPTEKNECTASEAKESEYPVFQNRILTKVHQRAVVRGLFPPIWHGWPNSDGRFRRSGWKRTWGSATLRWQYFGWRSRYVRWRAPRRRPPPHSTLQDESQVWRPLQFKHGK